MPAGPTANCRSYGEHHVVLLVGLYQPLLILRARLDGTARHRVAHYAVGHLTSPVTPFHDVEDFFFLQGIEAHDMLTEFLGCLLKGRHLFLVA